MGRTKRKPEHTQDTESEPKRVLHEFDGGMQKFTPKSKGLFNPPEVVRDAATNQIIAFPGLDDDDGGDFIGPPKDGIEYLKMVRSEARGVPSILFQNTEIKVSLGTDTFGDDGDYDEEGGYYEDEFDEEAFYQDDDAIIAAPLPEVLPERRSPLEEWTDSTLLPLFRECQKRFHSNAYTSIPPAYKVPIGVADWQSISRNPSTPPSFSFLKTLTHDNILKGLRYNADLLKPGRDCEPHFTRWLWALLIAVKPWEDLDEESLVTLRNVGKKAAGVLKRLKDAGELEWKSAAEKEAERKELETAIAEGTIKHRKGRRAKDDKYEPYTPSANTLATLDMLVSVVGEVWRQRDLLVDRITHNLGRDWLEDGGTEETKQEEEKEEQDKPIPAEDLSDGEVEE